MKQKYLMAVAVCAVLLLSVAAHAANYFYSGMQCNSISTDAAYSTQYGVYNPGSGLIDVWCPFNGIVVGTGGITSLSATVYDRSTTDSVSCTLYVFDQYGTQTYAGTQSTSTTGWSWSPSTLTWSSITGTASYYGTMKCTLPAYSSVTGGFSHMTTFKVTTN